MNSRMLAACGLSLLVPVLAGAQGACRAPSDAERAAIERGQETAREIVERGLKDSPWELGDWHSTAVVSRGASHAPIELCNDFVAVTLTLRRGSERGRMLDSIATASSSAGASAAMFDAIAGKTVSFRVLVNEPYLFQPWPAKRGEVLAVPGVPFATREIMHGSDGTTQASTELYLGDFAAAKQHVASKSYVPYPFRRTTGPYFENMEVKLEGTPGSLEDVVRRIEWPKLGTVLAP